MLRRTMLKGLALMPFGNQQSQGFNNPLLLSFAAGNIRISVKGLLVYSGTPANGNLIAGVTSVAGTDKYGNTFPAGIWSQNGAGTAYVQLFQSTAFFTSVTGNFITSLSQALNSRFFTIGSPNGNTTAVVNVPISGGLAAEDPTALAGTAETWHSLGTMSAGSGYTQVRTRYQLRAEGMVVFDIVLTAGAATVAGVYTFPALPAVYQPIDDRSYPMGWNGTVTAGMNFPSLRIVGGVVNLQLPALPNNTIISCTQLMPRN